MPPFVVSNPASGPLARSSASSLPAARALPVARMPSSQSPSVVSAPAVLPANWPLANASSHGGAPQPAAVGKPALVLLRHDLRLHDNPAIEAACKRSPTPPVLLYIFDTRNFGAATTRRSVHDARFLVQAVQSLRNDVEARGGVLHVRKGHVEDVLAEICQELRVKVVYAGVTSEDAAESDERIRSAMENSGIEMVMPNADAISVPRNQSSATNPEPIKASALEFRENPERFVKFLDNIPVPESLDGAPTGNLEPGLIPTLQQLGYKTHDIDAKPIAYLGGTAQGRKSMMNPQLHRGRCSCSVAKYLSFGCLSRRELLSCRPEETGLDQTLVRGELLWNEYWRLRQPARKLAEARAH